MLDKNNRVNTIAVGGQVEFVGQSGIFALNYVKALSPKNRFAANYFSAELICDAEFKLDFISGFVLFIAVVGIVNAFLLRNNEIYYELGFVP